MVSLWPWKGEDNSPAYFEKTLSTLSAKIAQSNTRLDAQRQHARRFKALWTLYTTFAYLLYSIILALVLGWRNWGVIEYAAVAGGPVLIYIVRTGASQFFDYRIASSAHHLNDLEKQRGETIEKLKAATKYNSTQQLLEKYGGESPKPSPKGDEKQRKSEPKPKPSTPQPPVPRTGLAPPPTANIRRGPFPESPATPAPPSAPSSPQNFPPPPYGMQNPPSDFPQPQTTPKQPVNEPGFAPNAFPASSQYIEQSHWYDRLLDVLLGEDETQLKNRLALICSACRLVNGQAPPGIKTPEELGRWRCGSCGTWNGEESEATKVLAGIRGQSQSQPRPASVNADGLWEPVSKTDADTLSSGDPTDEPVMVAASDDGSVDEDTPEEEPVKEEEPTSTKAGSRERSKGEN